MFTLTGIRIYPIKSLAGIHRSKASILKKGLEYDRRWMLVDEDGVCMTQREYTKMALFAVEETSEGFVISFQGDSITLSFNYDSPSDPVNVQVWDDRVVTNEVSQAFSVWFSQRLDVSCRLVAFPESNVRQIDTRFASSGENVSLADAFPLLIIGEASLADLNSRLREPLTMNRFRPNLIFSGGDPFEEDLWDEFSVGDNAFRGVKRCARCVLTTIDPVTAKKGPEPLKTLATYRKEHNKIFFGQNVMTQTLGYIRVGDPIHIVSRHEIAPDLKIETRA